MSDSGNQGWANNARGTLGRARRNFLTRTATDDAEQLLRRASVPALREDYRGERVQLPNPNTTNDTYGTFDQTQTRAVEREGPQTDVGEAFDFWQRRKSSRSPSQHVPKKPEKSSPSKQSVFRPIGGTEKLGTFTGVFVPTSLNVFSILMFIRFSFIVGQGGVLGTLVMLLVAYTINLVTTLSISAVASNGIVRGGGAYYLISRSLGPEFGGSIGIISYLGFVFNTGMNTVGLVDCLAYDFGSEQGLWAGWLVEGRWWLYLWSSIVLLLCVIMCLAGSAIFARASNGLLIILSISILSIPISAIFRKPFEGSIGSHYAKFTGLSLATLKENWLPHLTRGAAGSQLKGKETYQDLFGILFPATGGIFAGASMSGDLKNPSKSIPRGTLYGILLTFITYTVVIVAIGATITRKTLYRNVNAVQDVNLSGIVILLGELSTSIFSVLLGIVGPAKQLQAIARDGIFPGLKIFGQGAKKTDEPIYAILLTWALTQLSILFDINSLASLVTMAYLMMSLFLHLACLLLKLSSAPNFRPSFHYFNQWTALVGALLSIASMFFVDVEAATGCIGFLVFVFLIIHYTTPPKPWGSDVTSGLVYHQVRKYLLRLKTEHVKYWRPQILLFVNDPRRGYKLIQFSNSLKKGGLFILGHVIVTDNFGASVAEARRQQSAWTKYIEYMKIKSFVNVAISPSIEWGARNIVLSAGLGGMRPNIIMMGFYNLQQFRDEQPLVDVPSPPPEWKRSARGRRRSIGDIKESLPTDTCYVEKRTDMQSYVLVLEDMILKLHTNVAVAIGFSQLELPNPKEGNSRKYIDLWPIQMSAEIASEHGDGSHNLLTTNFDTYTLILQLGCILHTVPAWRNCFKLRVAVFVEYESDVEEERSRVQTLLESLRIEAEILVFWLACGDVKSYEHIVNGDNVDEEAEEQIDKVLEDETWWSDLRRARGKTKSGDISTTDLQSLADGPPSLPDASYSFRRDSSAVHFEGLRRILQGSRSRPTFGRLSRMGVSLNIRTHKLDDDLISRHASHHSGSELSVTESDADAVDESDSESPYVDLSLEADDEQPRDEVSLDIDQRQPDHASGELLSSKKSSVASSKKSKTSRKHRESPRASIFADRFSSGIPDQDGHLDYDADVESQPHRGRARERDHGSGYQPQNELSPGQALQTTDHSPRHRANSPNFTSAPVPVPKISNDEGQGPSIMFADSPHPRHRGANAGHGEGNMRSIYQRSGEDSRAPAAKHAQGFPSAASLPLSFNDLPSRAQHLILNELMSQNNEHTAVIFTTLPAPEEGTYKNESDSLTYLTDLEVLTQGLGPVLLVHSNSMTVTTNL